MFHNRQNADLRAANRFMQSNLEAVQNASLLLGGPKALNRTHELLDDLRSGTALKRRLKREMGALHDLLTLQNVADQEREECGFFADIDPTDPAIEEICFLSDGLLGILTQTDAEHELPINDLYTAV
ncbi:hypothetical protein DL239_15340 [Sedimentitalea sp. CY04]|uniref:Uncharacterized protein n=1 Tax=Parasedimentitalea denitrificans TaxID=2211118 RepID=A0ABX0WA84_9RHOB|nr:hypothetical protein [Sedimentitalea sp. CY04]NIZ62346.1 hypothetical protein [Sedimentitalea sp. CY04]